jgi:hypothetical protein
MSTGIISFPKNEEHNPGGNAAFYFRPINDVVSIPEAIAKLIAGSVVFASGVTGFFEGYSTPESLNFSEKQVNDNDLGPAFEVVVEGFYPCAHPDYDDLFDTIAQYRHIVLVQDNNERQRLAGNLEKGLRFTANFTTGGKFGNLKGYEFGFTGVYKERQPYYGSVPALEPPDCPPVVLSINGTEFDTYIAGSTPDIDVVDDTDTAVGSKVGSKWVVPIPKIFDSYTGVIVGNNFVQWTYNRTQVATITSVNFGGLTSGVVKINASIAIAPFNINPTDVVRFEFDTSAIVTEIRMQGTYV